MSFLIDGKMVNADGQVFSKAVKPNPLPETPHFTGLQGDVANSYGCFDGTNIWSSSLSKLKKYNIATDTLEVFDAPADFINPSTGRAFGIGWFDGKNLMCRDVLENSFRALNPETLAVTKIELPYIGLGWLPDSLLWFSTYDDQHLWVTAYYTKRLEPQKIVLFKIDKQTYNITYSEFSTETTPLKSVESIVRTQDSVFIINHNNYDVNSSTILKINPNTLNYETIKISKMPQCQAAFYSNPFIWTICDSGKTIGRYNTISKAFNKIIVSGTNLSNLQSSTTAFAGASRFDGRYIWMPPRFGDRYIRFDTYTSTAKGFDLAGSYDYGNLPTLTGLKFSGSAFDGENILFFGTERTVKLSPTAPIVQHLITEAYEDENGSTLQVSSSQNLVGGSNYTKTAPNIAGYDIIGYKINGAPLQNGATISLTNINQAHSIVFVYQQSNQVGDKVPAGSVMAFFMQNAPNGWLECNGAEVSRIQYARLFNVLSTSFGAGDGSTTFNLPDLRGEFLRGLDNGRGLDLGRTLGSSQAGTIVTGDANQADGIQVQAIAQDNIKGIANWDNAPVGTSINVAWINNSPYSDSAVVNDTMGVIGVTRPHNVAVLYCIKY